MTTTVRVNLNDDAVARAVNRPGGPGDRRLRRVAQRVERDAKRLAPVDTGRLRASIGLEGPRVSRSGLSYRITADVGYGIYVHQGTRYMRGREFLTDALRQVRL